MGDKTQIATVLLAAEYRPLSMVVAGTTLGMLVANLPVVALGARFADRLPLRYARWTAAGLFLFLARSISVSCHRCRMAENRVSACSLRRMDG